MCAFDDTVDLNDNIDEIDCIGLVDTKVVGEPDL